MNLPSLPTDNLYKFIAIAGLVLIIFSLWYLNETSNVVLRDSQEYKNKFKLLSIEQKHLMSDLTCLKEIINEKKEAVHDSIQETKFDESKDTSDASPYINLWARLQSNKDTDLISITQSFSELIIKQRELEKIEIELEDYESRYDNSLIQWKTYKVLFWVILLDGIFLMFLGFFLWFKKHQQYQDFLLKDEYEKRKESTSTNKQNKAKH